MINRCADCRHSLVSNLRAWLWCVKKPRWEYMSERIGECSFRPVKFEPREQKEVPA